MYCIYKHTSPNGEVYIGQTKQSAENRWNEGFDYLNGSKTKFAKAIIKYGWEQFTHEIIEKDIESLEMANEREIYWINFYDSYYNGLNSTLGGSGFHDGEHVYKIDINSLEIICEYPSIKAAGRAYGAASPAYIRKCCDRESVSSHGFYWCYVRDYTPDWKPINKKLYSSGNERRVIQIHCNTLEIIRVYNSIIEAQEALGVATISSCVRGAQKTAAGFYWCYEDDYPNWKPPIKAKRTPAKQIYQYSLEGELIQTYESVSLAAKINGYDASYLGKAARQNKKAYDYLWSYEVF